MRWLRVGAPALATFALSFAAVTWVALESQEVAVLRTRAPDGSPRETRVWVAQHESALWIEAATPERPWLTDLTKHPIVELTRDESPRSFRAEPMPGPRGHAKIRELLYQKYGWADCWVGLLQDTSRSIAVRLVPTEPPGGGVDG